MNLERLREKVLERHYPEEDETERLHQKYREISEYIEQKFDRETHFAGSAGRGTCMKGDNDVDIFVLFPESVEKKQLEDEGLKIGKSVFKEFDGEYRIEYAEHPYTKGEINGLEVEIVPCYHTSSEDIKSSVDRSPHHSEWVKKNLDQEQREDVVMLKRFLSAEGLYGSSLKVEGFSGYLCEVLIASYGSFRELVEEAQHWGENHILDPENHHEELSEKLEKKFRDEALIVIDPVDPERNVASVLSRENYARFVYLCWKFTSDPGIRFFEEEDKEYTEFEIRQEIKDRADFLVIEFGTPEEVDDVVYPQMRKTLERLENLLRKNDFRIFESGFHVGNRTRIFFELESELPETRELKGPRIFHGEEHIEQFRSKYDNVYVKEDRLIAKTEREYTEAKELLEDFLEEDLQEKGIPSYVAEKIQSFSFSDPLEGDKKWLNYLGQKLHVKHNDRS